MRSLPDHHTEFLSQLKLPEGTTEFLSGDQPGFPRSHTHCSVRVSRRAGAGVRCLLGGGGALQAAVSGQGPVFACRSAERTLPVFTTDLHLEHLLVALLILVG